MEQWTGWGIESLFSTLFVTQLGALFWNKGWRRSPQEDYALQADYVYACACAKWLQSSPTLVTSWTVVCQTPLSMGFSRQEYWSGLPCPPQAIFLMQWSNPCLLHLLHWQAGTLSLSLSGKPLNVHILVKICSHTRVTEMHHPGSLCRLVQGNRREQNLPLKGPQLLFGQPQTNALSIQPTRFQTSLALGEDDELWSRKGINDVLPQEDWRYTIEMKMNYSLSFL